jgi:hypothetical protein
VTTLSGRHLGKGRRLWACCHDDGFVGTGWLTPTSR